MGGQPGQARQAAKASLLGPWVAGEGVCYLLGAPQSTKTSTRQCQYLKKGAELFMN